MAEKQVKIQNKSDKPDNIVQKENEIFFQCEEIEDALPKFLRGYFAYLRANVLPQTRLAYLHDIRFFFQYLIRETDLTKAEETDQIKLEELKQVQAVDVNMFIDYCRKYKVETNKEVYIYENTNKTLARKKSSVSVLFKQLYRDNLLDENITDGFHPIRVAKPGEREIKALQDDEVMIMLDAVSTGEGLTPHEKNYWEKTRYRDKAILVMFLTYGLRLSELQQLNISCLLYTSI